MNIVRAPSERERNLTHAASRIAPSLSPNLAFVRAMAIGSGLWLIPVLQDGLGIGLGIGLELGLGLGPAVIVS